VIRQHKKKKKETWVQRDKNDSKLTKTYNSRNTKSDRWESISNLMGAEMKMSKNDMRECERRKGRGEN
jgi:hypothetical protein